MCKLFQILFILLAALPGMALAATTGGNYIDLTNHWVGYTAIGIFTVAYLLVMAEEFTHLRKSKPVILAAG
ncbi:MAG: sodium:proton antiporter, partial [Sedimenticola sp.]|nr:sodium:proton antiporter [Sedimenticola sp.]MCW8946550.1 sodium:proton antiporter [Sedimenticola sp.]